MGFWVDLLHAFAIILAAFALVFIFFGGWIKMTGLLLTPLWDMEPRTLILSDKDLADSRDIVSAVDAMLANPKNTLRTR